MLQKQIYDLLFPSEAKVTLIFFHLIIYSVQRDAAACVHVVFYIY